MKETGNVKRLHCLRNAGMFQIYVYLCLYRRACMYVNVIFKDALLMKMGDI